MKKGKKRIGLEKIKITKLNNKHQIKGGQTDEMGTISYVCETERDIDCYTEYPCDPGAIIAFK